MVKVTGRPIEILLVDDDPDIADLMIEAFEDSKIANHFSVVHDGVEAMAYLRREGKYNMAPRPAIVFLDLNMPRMDGRQVLAEMKEDPNLKDIPVAILTTSQADEDVAQAYKLHANCYLSKPPNMDGLIKLVSAIESFWFTLVELPPGA